MLFFRHLDAKTDIPFFGQCQESGSQIAEQFPDVGRRILQGFVIDFAFPHIENLVGERQQSVGIAFHGVELFQRVIVRGILGKPLDELVHGSDDQRERCAQVVADVGEEARLHLVEFCFLLLLPSDAPKLLSVVVPVSDEEEQNGAGNGGE